MVQNIQIVDNDRIFSEQKGVISLSTVFLGEKHIIIKHFYPKRVNIWYDKNGR